MDSLLARIIVGFVSGSENLPKRSIQYLHEKFESIDLKHDEFEARGQELVVEYDEPRNTVCSSMSKWTKHVIQPKLPNNMKDWSFTRKVTCPHFTDGKFPPTREKVSLHCDGKNSKLVTSAAKSTRDIFQVEFGNTCLNDVIDNCCHGGQNVPNVVHYIWYADRELGYFQFISFMSALRFMKPCLFLLHGDYIPKGTYWDHFISISPNVIHVKREKPTSVFGHKLAFEEHASDVMRIEALMSK